jgi:hypothetical protein
VAYAWTAAVCVLFSAYVGAGVGRWFVVDVELAPEWLAIACALLIVPAAASAWLVARAEDAWLKRAMAAAFALALAAAVVFTRNEAVGDALALAAFASLALVLASRLRDRGSLQGRVDG